MCVSVRDPDAGSQPRAEPKGLVEVSRCPHPGRPWGPHVSRAGQKWSFIGGISRMHVKNGL